MAKEILNCPGRTEGQHLDKAENKMCTLIRCTLEMQNQKKQIIIYKDQEKNIYMRGATGF